MSFILLRYTIKLYPTEMGDKFQSITNRPSQVKD